MLSGVRRVKLRGGVADPWWRWRRNLLVAIVLVVRLMVTGS
jgi:hypothetical protein